MLRVSTVVVLTLLLASLAFGAQHLARQSQGSLLAYHSPYLGWLPPLPPAEPPRSPLTGQVVLLMADGMTDEVSWRMPALQYLRSRGASAGLALAAPTLTPASWATTLTGTVPEIHGTVAGGPVTADHLLRGLKGSALTTAAYAGGAWRDLFGPWLNQFVEFPADVPPADSLALRPLSGLLSSRPALLVIQTDYLERVGARYGTAGPEYREAAAQLDVLLTRVVSGLNLDQSTVVVTAGYGLTPRGRHGGMERPVARVPLVMAGRGVQHGVFAPIPQVNLAPTLAVLLGVRPPAQAAGRPAADLLRVDRNNPGLARAREVEAASYRHDLQVLWLQPGAAPPATSGGTLSGTSEADLKTLESAARSARQARLREERLARLPWGGGAIAAALLLLVLLAWRRGLFTLALGPGVYFVAYYALFWGPWSFGPFFPGHALSFSWSAVNPLAAVPAFWRQRAAEALMAAALAALVSGLALRFPASRGRGGPSRSGRARGPVARPVAPVVAGFHLALTICLVLALQVAYAWVMDGPPYGLFLPDPGRFTKLQLDLLQLEVVGCSALGLGLLTRLAGPQGRA